MASLNALSMGYRVTIIGRRSAVTGAEPCALDVKAEVIVDSLTAMAERTDEDWF